MMANPFIPKKRKPISIYHISDPYFESGELYKLVEKHQNLIKEHFESLYKKREDALKDAFRILGFGRFLSLPVNELKSALEKEDIHAEILIDNLLAGELQPLPAGFDYKYNMTKESEYLRIGRGKETIFFKVIS